MRVALFTPCIGRNDGGTETYERRLLHAIADLDRDNEYHAYCHSPAARDTLGTLPPNVRAHGLRPRNRVVSFGVTLPASLAMLRPAVVHATFVPPPICPAKLVFTMHDVSMFLHPEFYDDRVRLRLNAMIKKGLRQAKQIICVSQNAKDTTAELLGVDPARMTVVHHGIDDRYAPIPKEEAAKTVKEQFGVDGPFVFYLGKITARKNTVRLLEAYADFRDAVSDPPTLVLGGTRYYDTGDVDEVINRRGLQDHIVELGYVPDGATPALYSAAEWFLYATLWEGFGFPAVEAMACGCPVLTSSVSSLPEIVGGDWQEGGAALLVDPKSVESIAASMVRLHEQPVLRADLRARGLSHVTRFSWRRAAQETIEVYKAAAAS